MRPRKWNVELSLDELLEIERALSQVASREKVTTPAHHPEGADLVAPGALGKIAEALASPLARDTAEAHSAEAVATLPTWPDEARRAVIVLDEPSLTVTLFGRPFPCKPTSFRLLEHLIHHQGRWVRSETLKHEVLRVSVQPGSSNIRWHVLQARRALHSAGHMLHSDCRLGYMFALGKCQRRHCLAPEERHSGSAHAARARAGSDSHALPK